MSDTDSAQSEADAELTRLRAEIERANAAYYLSESPVMDDASYDRLRARIANLEADFPHLAKPLPVGTARTAADRVLHVQAMLSLDNAFTEADITAFRARVRKLAELSEEDESPALCASPKIDGLAVSLRYQDGQLVQGATRGDGASGEDITANLRKIADIPRRLSGSGWPSVLHVRGEIHMYLTEFAAYNATAEAKGERVFVNPRNAASGEVRRIHVGGAPLPLHFSAYDWVEDIAATASEGMEQLRNWGVPVVEHRKTVTDPENLAAYYRDLEARRAALDYDIDGVVVVLDDIATRAAIGATAHHPRWAIAWKFPAETALTRITDISVQVGRTGSLTPVAHLSPVTIGGVTVSRASLHNEDEIARKDVRIGDWALVRRAGDVIPQVVEIERGRRGAESSPYIFPSTCPECGSPAVREEDEARRRCAAGYDCPAQRLGLLEHFVSRAGFDIEGLGPKQLALFDERGLVATPADIFRLRKTIPDSSFGPLSEWHGFGKKSADALFSAIDARRKISMERFLTALGIRHLGPGAASDIGAHFRTMEALLAGLGSPDGEETLADINGIGPVTAKSVSKHFGDARTRAIINDLIAEIEVADAARRHASTTVSPIAGKTVVFTGKLEDQSRAEAQARAKALGARVSSAVSRKTDYLVAGESAGSKLTESETLGITILDEAGWNDLIGSGGT